MLVFSIIDFKNLKLPDKSTTSNDMAPQPCIIIQIIYQDEKEEAIITKDKPKLVPDIPFILLIEVLGMNQQQQYEHVDIPCGCGVDLRYGGV